MSAAYSEASFALWTFAMMYYLEQREYTKTTIALGLAVGTRSNGLVLVGYPAYIALRVLLEREGDTRCARFINLSRYVTRLRSCNILCIFVDQCCLDQVEILLWICIFKIFTTFFIISSS